MLEEHAAGKQNISVATIISLTALREREWV